MSLSTILLQYRNLFYIKLSNLSKDNSIEQSKALIKFELPLHTQLSICLNFIHVECGRLKYTINNFTKKAIQARLFYSKEYLFWCGSMF